MASVGPPFAADVSCVAVALKQLFPMWLSSPTQERITFPLSADLVSSPLAVTPSQQCYDKRRTQGDIYSSSTSHCRKSIAKVINTWCTCRARLLEMLQSVDTQAEIA